ncbi:MAG: PQQ-binding-like beta-propeller repeat protein [Methanobacteriota archaeon]|nr:MAG: PQQ-binding-like beta-propeller repeat protein [Euryarchaeota archaeon]
MEDKNALKVAFALGIGFLFMLSLQPVVGDDQTDQATVLFDLGNGEFYWATLEIGENRTAVNLSERAAENLNLEIAVEWSMYGAWVASIGDVECPVTGYWQFLDWDDGNKTWAMSMIGTSYYMLEDGDVIAYYCDPDFLDSFSPFPVPTPDHKYPSFMFRGTLENVGTSSGSAPSSAGLKWDYDTGEIEIDSSAAVGYGKVFIVGFRGLYVLDQETGALVWENTGITGQSSPALYDGMVLLGGADGKLYCLDADTGEVLWSTLLEPRTHRQSITSSPKVWNNTVFIGTFNEAGGNASVYALHLENGSVKWEYERVSVYHSSPAISDGVLFIGMAGLAVDYGATFDPFHGLVALDALGGEKLWEFGTYGPVLSSPAIYDDNVYFTSKDGYLYSMKTSDGFNWAVPIQDSTSSPAISDGKLYVGTGINWNEGGKLLAYDLDGNLLWDYDTPGPVQSSPSIADGKVYFATNEMAGKIFCLDASTGDLVWSYQPSPASYILSSPVIADGQLFIGSDNGHIYAFEDKEGGPTQTGEFTVGLEVVAVIIIVIVAVALLAVLWRRRK